MFTIFLCMFLSIFWDAPLKELANPQVPENPAKAPWYFLGLQEVVSFSAFMGGIGIPTLCVVALGLIPYLDRESEGTGTWFGGPGGVPLVLGSVVFGLAAVIGVEAFAIQFGWLREW
jgi:quinol-cytochrome oxidoreductase complex cytochrome b subunit